MKFLNITQDDHTILQMGDFWTVRWNVDAAFAVHRDLNSHSGAVMILGRGELNTIST
jgi:hypothetical protein